MFRLKFPGDATQTNYGKIVSLLFVGGCVTLAVIMDMLVAWHGFDWHKKFEAVCFLSVLIVGPIRFMRVVEKPSVKVSRADIAMWGYLGVMMAMIVFGR